MAKRLEVYAMITFRLIFAFFLTLFAGWFSLARADDTALADEIVEFLKSTEQSSADTPDYDRSDFPTIALMASVSEAVENADIEIAKAALEQARMALPYKDDQSNLAHAVEMTEMIIRLSPDNFHSSESEPLITYLSETPSEYGWYLRSTGLLLAGYLNISRRNMLIASRYFEEANTYIPSELSPYVTEAKLQASVMTTLVHGIQGNVEFLLESARTEYEMRSRIGETVDRTELITNFIYALNQNRDFESAAKVGELLPRDMAQPTSIPGLGETYLAETHLELQNYARSETVARTALDKLDHPTVQRRAKAVLMVALAGQGQIEPARKLMRELGWTYSETELLTTPVNPKVLNAEALIAMHQGRGAQSVSLLLRQTDMLFRRMQATNGADITVLLANLENTRERQLERENALKREAELKAVQLEQQRRLNTMLQITLGLLAAAFVAALIFLRYREHVNAKLRRLNEDALSAERMKIEFLGVVNHELRTPLNGIIGMSDALIHHAQDPIIRSQAKTIQDSGQILFDMIKSLIDMSTLDNGKMTLDADDMNLARIIAREAIEWDEAAAERGLTYTRFVSPELHQMVLADDDRIGQCVRILLSNAIRFTESGRVHLHATGEDRDGQTELTVIIADTGRGMSSEVLDRLFTPFLQADLSMKRKDGGVGLNLAIARQLARLMGGDITVTSNPGRGSEFVFTARLPHATAEPRVDAERIEVSRPVEHSDTRLAKLDEPMPSAEPSAQLDTRNAAPETPDNSDETESDDLSDEALFDVIDLMIEDTAFENSPSVTESVTTPQLSSDLLPLSETPRISVLIVEDEASNRDVIKVLLEPEGYECLQVSSAMEGLELLDLRSVDLVIMDIRMPEMTGIEAIHAIRLKPEPTSTVPIVVLTADAKSETREQAMQAGADMFLTKPIDRRTLLGSIERCLEETKARASSTPRRVA